MHIIHETNSAYLDIQSDKQHHKFVVLHLTYLRSQSLQHHENGSISSHSQDRLPSLPRVTPCPLPSLAWLLGLACPGFCYQLAAPAVPMNHTYRFSYNYHVKPKSFYTCSTLWAQDTLHVHIYKLWLLFLFFLPVARQVS